MSRSDIRSTADTSSVVGELVDEIQDGDDELVEQTMTWLIEREEAIAYVYDGFFRPMDTLNDRQALESLFASGAAPWWRLGALDGSTAA